MGGRVLPRGQTDPGIADRRLALAREWDDLLAEIRADPEFADFLKPPSYEELLTAAAGGPLFVINSSRWRCDALVVHPSGVEVIPLPGMTLDDAKEQLTRHLAALRSFDASVEAYEVATARWESDPSDVIALANAQSAATQRRIAQVDMEQSLERLCGWIFDVVVVPILDALPRPGDDGQLPRVWWCPTGPLTLLPIHAAGRGETWLADLVVSSYTPTVRALVDARRPGRDDSRGGRFMVASTLPDSDSSVCDPLAEIAGLDVVTGGTLAEVVEALPSCRFVHFDCHADQDLDDPSRGGIAFPDGILRVFDIAAMPLAGDFVALAACKTAVGGADLLDEAITLAASIHYTGFRHVVASLWNLSDEAAREVFPRVYATIGADGFFDSSRSAAALSDAVSELRRAGAGIHTWAPFIHLGP